MTLGEKSTLTISGYVALLKPKKKGQADETAVTTPTVLVATPVSSPQMPLLSCKSCILGLVSVDEVLIVSQRC